VGRRAVTSTTPDHEADASRSRRSARSPRTSPCSSRSQLSYAREEEAALEGAIQQWRANCIPGPVTQQLRSPADDDAVRDVVPRDQVQANVRVSADLEEHARWIERDRELDVDRIYLHDVNTSERAFLADVGNELMPADRGVGVRLAAVFLPPRSVGSRP
jgi:hypothetical protein